MGSGPPPRPQTLRPTSFYFNVLSRRGKVAEIEFEVRATRPSPALARAMRPHLLAGSIRHARAAPHLPLTLALPSIRGHSLVQAHRRTHGGKAGAAAAAAATDAVFGALLAPPPSPLSCRCRVRLRRRRRL